MFRLHIGFLCHVVAFFILFGVSHSTSESVCVLSDAPKQCSAFCMAALQPLYNHCQNVRELLDILASNQTATARRLESTLQSRPEIKPAGTVPQGFQKIGSRYFLIEESKMKSWTDAEETCREKGGHLASFRNIAEFHAVRSKVFPLSTFWLGGHRNSEDEFVTATGNKGSYIKWHFGQPNNFGGQQNCVALSVFRMNDMHCDHVNNFICQLDTV
ncbi:ladderlectin-like [Drosophila teissieri]|uniref:ladderlectin-like n=1 Tax=Drosophila teissieri TaxID=7243 RepID=UPI001CB9EB97|nr:ladderlectin-like [Drosophila teissieri]